MIGTVVAAWLKRMVPSLLLDAVVVFALAFPEVSAYARWPLLGLYGVLSWVLLMDLSANRWILTIVRDPATRIAHGLEHAALAVCAEGELPVVRGFTHGRDRFVVVLEAGQGQQLTAVREAATRSIRRILDGERSLAYQPGCGTSEVVSSVTLWLAYVTTMLISLAVGGSAPIFLAVSVILFRFWLACQTALGLLAQRLFTVSREFASASVLDVREVVKAHGIARPEVETWFEVLVEVKVATSTGGLVSPGTLA